MQTKWLSAYIFSTTGLNRVLCEQVAPFLQAVYSYLQTPAPYFFIRYGEGGPHIRLRLQVLEEDETTVRKILNEHTQAQYIPYIQEVERYGNATTIALAEQQFYLCSDYVLSLINHPEWDISSALTQAIQMNMALLYASGATPDETTNILTQFIRSWLPRLYNKELNKDEQEKYFMSLLEEKFNMYASVILPLTAAFWSTLQTRQTQTPAQQYAGKHISLLQQYQQVIGDTSKMRSIICSLLHMQHNRLGISNADEAYIVFFTMKCMEHIYEQVS